MFKSPTNPQFKAPTTKTQATICFVSTVNHPLYTIVVILLLCCQYGVYWGVLRYNRSQILRDSVMVAQGTLDPLIMVRIHVPQLLQKYIITTSKV